MDTEFKALMNNKTWELVPFSEGMNVVSNKWVFRTKYKADGTLDKFKARLVAGFQQTVGVGFFKTYSPVFKESTIRVIFILAVTFGRAIQQIDVNNAFLNGDLQEQVFMEQPKGFIDS